MLYFLDGVPPAKPQFISPDLLFLLLLQMGRRAVYEEYSPCPECSIQTCNSLSLQHIMKEEEEEEGEEERKDAREKESQFGCTFFFFFPS